MLQSERMRMMLESTKSLQGQYIAQGGMRSQETQNYIDARNAILEREIHRQELKELYEAMNAPSDDENYSLTISSEVRNK